ncbi:MAG: aspartate kinase [Cytophagales bacterium]|nr:MAG: aspartate kinase [Cytophagales bacterium]
MKILKFGGTSVGRPERMQSVASLVFAEPDPNKVVVLSALSGVTNHLVKIAECAAQNAQEEIVAMVKQLETQHQDFAKQLLKTEDAQKKALVYIQTVMQLLEKEKNEKVILAQGELLSTHLFHYYLEEKNVESRLIPALEFMRIDEHSEPDLAFITQAIQQWVSPKTEKGLWVTQGYICRDAQGNIDNLKRGGSDYTASLIGAALKADEVQIWTDIDGMHNNDPRYVENTQPVAELSFDEAAELAYFGAKILHPATILPAQKYNVPVRLLNTMQPQAKGTIIRNLSNDQPDIKSLAAKDGIVAINIKSSRMLLAYGFLRKIFEIFEKYKTPIDMITTSEVAVSLTIDDTTHLQNISEEIKEFATVEIDSDQTIICIVGNRVDEQRAVAGKIFTALQHIPIRMISFGGSKQNVSLLIQTKHKIAALKALHEGLFQHSLTI